MDESSQLKGYKKFLLLFFYGKFAQENKDKSVSYAIVFHLLDADWRDCRSSWAALLSFLVFIWHTGAWNVDEESVFGKLGWLLIQLELLWKFSLLNSRVLLIPSFETIKQCVVLIAQQIRSMGWRDKIFSYCNVQLNNLKISIGNKVKIFFEFDSIRY